MENIKENTAEDNALFGGFFSYLGNQISTAAHSIGIDKYYNDAKTNIDHALTDYGLKGAFNEAVGYAKTAGNYVMDKGKEISENQMVKDAINKVSEGVNVVKTSATNYITTIAQNITNQQQIVNGNSNSNSNDRQDNNKLIENNQEEEKKQNIYQQLNNDHL